VVDSAASAAVLFVDPFSLVCLVSLLLSIVKRNGSAFDFVLDGVIRTPQMLCNPVDCPDIFQTNFNFSGIS